METDLCSRWAYSEIIESGYVGKRQGQYLFIFSRENLPMTHREVSALVNKEFNLIVPERNGRVAELEAMGFIRKYDKVRCSYTRKFVNRWVWTGVTQPAPKPAKNEKDLFPNV